jgi:hypothetical protein
VLFLGSATHQKPLQIRQKTCGITQLACGHQQYTIIYGLKYGPLQGVGGILRYKGRYIMAHEMTVRLTDDEYAALTEEAKLTGQELGELIQEMLDEIVARRIYLAEKTAREFSNREFAEYLYREGVITHIPTGKRRTADEEAELKRLGERLGQGGGKSASEMVIEDRGPY